jgi:hypothetical protein
MTLRNAITTKGDTVWVRFSDEDDQAKAKVWINVEAPPDPVEATSELLPDKVDRYLLGIGKKPQQPGDFDRHRLGALRHVRRLIDAEISALESKYRK